MQIEKVYQFEATEEEIGLIRSALCEKALKELCRAHEAQLECYEDGLEDGSAHLHFERRKQIRSIVDKIDAAR
jgi:hypothetical protein